MMNSEKVTGRLVGAKAGRVMRRGSRVEDFQGGFVEKCRICVWGKETE